jgi:hypothetical protein
LSQLYTPEIVALMIDVSDYEQEPGETWAFDGEVFVVPLPPEPPPPPSKDELLARLETAKQAYIDARYPPPTREWMIAFWNIASEAQKAVILQAWGWVDTAVMAYFDAKATEIENGSIWEELAVDFEQFNESDPGITRKMVLDAS